MTERKPLTMIMTAGTTWHVPHDDKLLPDAMLNCAEQICHNIYSEYEPKNYKNGKAIND